MIKQTELVPNYSAEVPTPEEVKIIAECDSVISKHKQAFIDVAKAIMRMKEGRLYRFTHKTFDLYLQAKHGFTRQYSCMLLKSSEAAEKVSTVVNIPTEYAARQLSKVPPERQIEVAKKAAALGKPITAKTIAKVSPPPKSKPFKAPKETPRQKEIRELEDQIENGNLRALLRDSKRSRLTQLLAEEARENPAATQDAVVETPPPVETLPFLPPTDPDESESEPTKLEDAKARLMVAIDNLFESFQNRELTLQDIQDGVKEMIEEHLV